MTSLQIPGYFSAAVIPADLADRVCQVCRGPIEPGAGTCLQRGDAPQRARPTLAGFAVYAGAGRQAGPRSSNGSWPGSCQPTIRRSISHPPEPSQTARYAQTHSPSPMSRTCVTCSSSMTRGSPAVPPCPACGHCATQASLWSQHSPWPGGCEATTRPHVSSATSWPAATHGASCKNPVPARSRSTARARRRLHATGRPGRGAPGGAPLPGG